MSKRKILLIKAVLAFIAIFFISCNSIPENKLDFSDPDFISRYYASSDEECNFIFEFINQTNTNLRLEPYIAEIANLQNQYYPLVTSPIITLEAGEVLTYKLNVDQLTKDFNSKYAIGINCFEKQWHWWQNIDKKMKNRRFRITVKNENQEGGQFYTMPFKSKTNFSIKEFSVEYKNQNYMAYLITDAPDEYLTVYDTRIFYTNTSNNSSRKSNIYTCSCKKMIQEFLDNGEFYIANIDGYKCLMLNKDPLDLNNYIKEEKDDYDFIYEIINDSSEKIAIANIIYDEKNSYVLAFTNDIEIEAGKSYQIRYNLDTLKKVYGEKNVIGLDVKNVEEGQWIRGWFNSFDYKNDKHTVVVSNGTNGRKIDIFDLWSDFSNLEKGLIIY